MTAPSLRVQPTRSMADEPIHIRVEGLLPGQEVTLRLISAGGGDFCLASHATFVANEAGCVDVAQQAPVAGTYARADGMGLFWSQRRVRRADVPQASGMFIDPHHYKLSLPSMLFLITAEIDGEVVDAVQLERVVLSDDILRVPIREQGLVATLFHHRDGQARPGVIFWGGSEGGLFETPAALFARHGFTTLSLAYFGMEHLPAELINIPLEYIKTAIDWFRAQPVVRREPGIGIWGASRGGELALLVASTYAEVKAVVSVCGSGLIMGGVHKTADFRFAAWTYRGTPLPYVQEGTPLREYADTRDWAAFCRFYAENLDRAAIPVERIVGAVLCFSGGQDRVWNSVELTNVAMARLRACGFAHPYEHVCYPKAGHVFRPYSVTDHERYGGSPEANADAGVDTWQRTVAFFRQHLRGASG